MRYRRVTATPARGPTGPDMTTEGPSASRVQSVDRAVRLLWAVAESGAGGAPTTALAETCGLNRATAWRLLWTLESHGLVVNDRSSGQWSLGRGVVEMARAGGIEAVLHDVRSVLDSMAMQTGETAALAVVRGGTLVYVDEATPPAAVAVSWVGRPISLHATSTGKVLLAWSTPAEVDRLLPARLEGFTATTITDRDELDEHLHQTRGRGWAECRGELDESAWGVSAPVLDRSGRLLAVLSIWGPPPRITTERFPAVAQVCLAAAARMSPA